ncbi:MAG: ABC transporter ATP-binding protein [Candidatus Bathyarchaeia archaeon]
MRNDGEIVSAEGVTKVYSTGGLRYEALRGISIRIESGELISIVGPSGSGKSTLLHIMGLIDKPSSGRVFFEGRDTSKMGEDALAMLRNERIGFVFQAYNLVHRLTALENVELPLISRGIDPKIRRERAMKMLELVGLSSKYKNRPYELSGGEQQRVAIARALVTNPSIVFGDEITGNLDSKTTLQIVELVREINESTGTAFVLVTHNPEVAAATRRRIFLRDGRIERDERREDFN